MLPSPLARQVRVRDGLVAANRGKLRTARHLVTDAQIAALVLESDAVLHTTDPDFLRCAALRWLNPLTGITSRQAPTQPALSRGAQRATAPSAPARWAAPASLTASYSVSGAMSAPYGHTTVPPSMKNRWK